MVFNWFRRKFTDSDQASAESEAAEVERQPPESPSEPEPAPETPAADIAADRLAWAKAAYKNIQQRQQEAASEPGAAATEAPAEPSIEASPEQLSTPEVEAPDIETSIGLTAAIAESEAAIAAVPKAIQTELPVPEPEEPLGAPAEAQPETIELQTALSEDQPAAIVSETQTLEVEPEQIAEDLSSVAATSVDEIVPPPPESPVETPEAVEALPFWAKAEAERQERLERLKATAIETEQAVEPVVAVEPAIGFVPPAEITPSQPDSPQPTEEAPAVAFDEGFLWSAEVLAAQGRKPEEVSVEEITWLQKLRRGLGKTRRGLVNQLKAVVGQGPLSQDAVLEIESLLLQADVGVEATDTVIQALQAKLRQEALPPDAAIAYLKQILRDILDRPLQSGYSASFMPDKNCLNIWLMTGVNGVGKTTTIGKIAHVATESGYQCLIGAADTFRAAAVEQVKVWGERSQVEVIANPGKNTDPAAVVFDAIAAAQSRKSELLLIDTAGRLQNKQNLMEELRKIRRIVDKKAPGTKVESLLVLDATLGQNGLRQAQVFAEAAQLTGVVVTKLDGTAKGGVALAVVQQLGLPIRFIGAGEGIGDLRPFSSYEFVEALLSD
ncbi:MAG: signal recognition particle-docking protein FtsY [Aphanocapsa sp. GSE-SYN-MK-11-07L]|jgi:fused signal recognition particle receptor|nr:signal recognition particle-docking protein FtsY [Aphanocapsa sp. GSE-SYN-MK-11-07L]